VVDAPFPLSGGVSDALPNSRWVLGYDIDDNRFDASLNVPDERFGQSHWWDNGLLGRSSSHKTRSWGG